MTNKLRMSPSRSKSPVHSHAKGSRDCYNCSLADSIINNFIKVFEKKKENSKLKYSQRINSQAHGTIKDMIKYDFSHRDQDDLKKLFHQPRMQGHRNTYHRHFPLSP